MSAKEAQKKFGKKEFSKASFKSGAPNVRGEMTADLILKKHFVGKPLTVVTQELGAPDGYYENDQIPAYIISKKEKDIWQVVFLPDSEWKNVAEVLIHKNCCAK